MELTETETSTPIDAPDAQEFPRHPLEGPELLLCGIFYPNGFAIEVRTNSHDALQQYTTMWGKFEQRHATDPITVDVQVVSSDADVCPPAPAYRFMLPLMIASADADNYCVVDLDRCHASIIISQAALRHPLYAQYFLLGIPMCCITSRYTTPVHAACVSLNDRGILLCGDSGAGKSTLAYACARAGWTYISDDACFLLDQGIGARVSGNCHQVRFRPTAAELFPELAGLELTPRAAGKPSIELSTEPMQHIVCAPLASVHAIVFIDRSGDGPPRLLAGDVNAARKSMREILYGSHQMRALQHQAIDRLLTVPVYQLRYSSLDDATRLLRQLAEARL